MSQDQQPTSRRVFLKTIVLSAASIVVLPQIVRAAEGGGQSPSGATAEFIDLGPKAHFTGTWTQVVLPDKYNGQVIYVRQAPAPAPAGQTEASKTQPPAPEYQALSSRCTHRGCTVDYKKDMHEFICPCHHGIFNEAGKPVSGPPDYPLHTIPTKLDANGHLLIQAPDANGRW